MELSAAILAIAAALAAGAMSPGPSFLMVARMALSTSRRDALAAAVGMGIGGVAFALVALLGLLALLAAVPLLYGALKVLGGAYLLYLGYRIWRGASMPLPFADADAGLRTSRPWRSFVLGLTTQVSNPKTAVVYASVFASLLPDNVPPVVVAALPILVFAIETAWYSVVAVALSAPLPRARYLAAKAWFDRGAGGVMALLGIKLLVEAPRP